MTTTSQLYELAFRARFKNLVSDGAHAAATSMEDLVDAVEATDTAVRKSSLTLEQLAAKFDPITQHKKALARADREYAQTLATATQAVERDAAAQAQAAAVIQAAAVRRAEATRRADEALERSQQRFAAFDAAMSRSAGAHERAADRPAHPIRAGGHLQGDDGSAGRCH